MSSSTPPPGGPVAPPRPPLRRRRDGKLLAGVLAGVADHLGIDVAVARILFVVLTLFSQGILIVAYVLGWVLIPEESDAEAAAPRPPRREDIGGRDPLFWIGIATLIIGALWLLDGPFPGRGPFPFVADRGVLVPLVLIAFGIALWRAADRSPNRPAAMPPGRPSAPPAGGQPPFGGTSPGGGQPPAFAPASPPVPASDPRSFASRPETSMSSDDARTDTVRIDRPTDGPGDTRRIEPPPAWEPPPPGVPPRAPGEGGGDGRDWTPPPVPESRGILTRITLGAALLTVGVLWLLNVADATALRPGQIVSAALLVVGVGLLVGSVVGRGRGLIGAGLLLLPVVLVLQLLRPFPVDAFTSGGQPAGQRFETPAVEAEVRDTYTLGAGELRIDLSEVQFTDDRDVTVQTGFGDVTVYVPEDVTVEVHAQSGAGQMTLLGQRTDGVGLDRTVVDEVPGSDVRLTLDVQVGFGQIRVERDGRDSDPAPEFEGGAATDENAAPEDDVLELEP
ncbi:PspC domain-containing protein [Egicoccus sp. AB-alg2]|uniref:PspC domain-containing protein n=1 Tax=Egicoccus sp. AB-alg2 TaxID=3242693 RepID=UPI00359E83AC